MTRTTPVDASSLPENGWERSLHVAHVCRDRWRWARLDVVSWLKLGLVVVALDGDSARDGLLRVLLVDGELGKGLVVAYSGRVRRPEWLVMLNSRGSLRFGSTVGQHWILLEDLFVRVKRILLPHALRERLLLQLGVVILALQPRHLLGPVIVVLDVGHSASKGDLFANLTLLDRICQDILGRDDDVAWVLLILVILLNLDKVGHVLVRGLHGVLDMRLGLEWLFITVLNLPGTVFFALEHLTVALNVRVTDRSEGLLVEEYLVDSRALFDRIGSDVGRVNDDLLGVVGSGVDASCEQRIPIR